MSERAKDIWYAKNQPYGYWRVGNPIIKISVIIIMLFGIIYDDPSLTLQGSILTFLMLWAPFNPRSIIQNLFINLGLGAFMVSLFLPSILPYDYLRIVTNIPSVAKIEWLWIGIFFIMGYALFSITRAITSRDYAWFVDLCPKVFKKKIAGIIFSFPYGLLRAPIVFEQTNISIRSRGFHLPFSFKAFSSFEFFINTLGIWILLIYRETNEMVLTIDYVLVSRVKPLQRRTPIARVFSVTDLGVFGVIIFSIFIPRVM